MFGLVKKSKYDLKVQELHEAYAFIGNLREENDVYRAETTALKDRVEKLKTIVEELQNALKSESKRPKRTASTTKAKKPAKKKDIKIS